MAGLAHAADFQEGLRQPIFNGITLAGLYFLVASGFTLVFGLMRNVNLAHGSLYLLGAYVGYEVGDRTGYWLLGVAAGFLSLALVGGCCRSSSSAHGRATNCARPWSPSASPSSPPT